MRAKWLDENALDLVQADFIAATVVIRDFPETPALSRRHSPTSLHSRSFSRLQSLPPPLPQGRVVAGFRNAQNAAGLRDSGARIVMGKQYLADQARGKLRGPAKPDVPL